MTKVQFTHCVLGPGGTVRERNGDAVMPLYSITKSLIAALVLDAGLDLERPVAGWLDTTWLPRGADITLRHLLTHTGGLTDYGGLDAYNEAVHAGGTAWDDRRFADATLTQPLLFAPGEGWAYSNPGFWALKRVLEIETGESLAALVESRIAGPLGLATLKVATGLFSTALPGYEAGWVWHGLACATAEDTARFMASPLAAPLARPRVPVPDAGPEFPDAAYGLGVMTDGQGRSFGHNGSGPGFSTSCFHFPATGITVCCLMENDGPGAPAYEALQALAARHGAW